MTLLWIVLVVVVAILWVITVSDIIRRDLNGGQTATWLIIVLIVPVVGALLYWAMRRSSYDSDTAQPEP
jgi:cytochrome bd-type quinol oxidase subunit 2